MKQGENPRDSHQEFIVQVFLKSDLQDFQESFVDSSLEKKTALESATH